MFSPLVKLFDSESFYRLKHLKGRESLTTMLIYFNLFQNTRKILLLVQNDTASTTHLWI